MADSPPRIDAAAIQSAVNQLARCRPAYASILSFYGPVFMAQIEAVGTTSPVEIDMDASLLDIKTTDNVTLINPAAFPIDLKAARTLLLKICHIAMASGEKVGDVARVLLDAMDDGLAINNCFGEGRMEKGQIPSLAKQLNVDAESLSHLFSLATKPSIEKSAQRIARRLTTDVEDRGHCPICECASIIGELDQDGRQWLHCGLCAQRWPAKRLVCPFCSNHDSNTLEYLFSDEEPEYRLNLCSMCRRYLKIVDVRKISRCFFPPLEQVTSLHLDMLASQKGYYPSVAAPN